MKSATFIIAIIVAFVLGSFVATKLPDIPKKTEEKPTIVFTTKEGSVSLYCAIQKSQAEEKK